MTARQVTSLVGEFLALTRRTAPPYFFWRSPEGDVLMAGGCRHAVESGDTAPWREWARTVDMPGEDASVMTDAPVISMVGFDPDRSGPEAQRGAAWEGGKVHGLVRLPE